MACICRLLDSFVDMGVENANAANISGVCKGLSTLRCTPKESVWQALQLRAAELVDEYTLEDMRRCACLACLSAACVVGQQHICDELLFTQKVLLGLSASAIPE